MAGAAALALTTAGMLAGVALLAASLTAVPVWALDRWGGGLHAYAFGLLGVFGGIAMIFVSLTAGQAIAARGDNPCARYSHTTTKGVQYQTCDQRRECAP